LNELKLGTVTGDFLAEGFFRHVRCNRKERIFYQFLGLPLALWERVSEGSIGERPSSSLLPEEKEPKHR
jgi:hypothetical protein